MTRFFIFIAIAFLPLCTTVLQAQTITFTAGPAVSPGSGTYEPGIVKQSCSDVHIASGKIIEVWSEPEVAGSGNPDIFCAIYNSDATSTLITKFRINNTTAGIQYIPAVKVNQKDNFFVIAWSGENPSSIYTPKEYDVYAKLIPVNVDQTTANGIKNTPDLMVNNLVPDNQIAPLIAFDYAINEMLIAWRDMDGGDSGTNGTDGNLDGAFYRRLTYPGNVLTPKLTDYRLNIGTNGSQLPGGIEFSQVTGELIVMMQSNYVAGQGVLRRIFRYDYATDQYIGESTETSLATGSGLLYPQAFAVNAVSGMYAVGWVDSGVWTCYINVYSPSHTLLYTSLLSSTGTGTQHCPKLVFDEGTSTLIGTYLETQSVTKVRYRILKYNSATNAFAWDAAESDLVSPVENVNNPYARYQTMVFSPVKNKVVLSYNTYLDGSQGKAILRVISYTNPASPAATGTTIAYSELKSALDEGYTVTTNNTIYFRYEEKYAVSNTALAYKVYDDQMNVVANSSPVLTKVYGLNYFSLPVSGLSLIPYQYYVLEVQNDKGEKKYIRIKYIPS